MRNCKEGEIRMKCPNCGGEPKHFVPPSMGVGCKTYLLGDSVVNKKKWKTNSYQKKEPIQVQISYSEDGEIMYIRAGYDKGFIDALKKSIPWQERKWIAKDKIWSVNGGYFGVASDLIDAFYEGKKDSIDSLPDAELYRTLYLIPGAPEELVVEAYGVLGKKYSSSKEMLSKIITAYSSIMDKLDENKSRQAKGSSL